MLAEHPSIALDKGLSNCFTCHNKNKPSIKENVTATYCNQCHWFEDNRSASEQEDSPDDKDNQVQL
ncbi:MAG: hypothetical protein H0Z35_12205 [Thermoanaerobacteraceae bacterium]|nr:hypothetical protein [Thermoanaerobacteraceae bacterium]